MTNFEYQFPSCIAYGKLNKESCRYNAATQSHSATYEMNGIPVLEAEVSPGRAIIIERFGDEVIGKQEDEDLKSAVFKYYSRIIHMTNAVHIEWAKQVIDAGNVYLDLFDSRSIRFLFFPSVFFVSIHIPLPADCVKPALFWKEHNAPVNFNTWIQQVEIVTKYTEKTTTKILPVLSLSCPVSHVPETITDLHSRGIISDEKRFRAIAEIVDLNLPVKEKIFMGHEFDSWTQYSLTYETINPKILTNANKS